MAAITAGSSLRSETANWRDFQPERGAGRLQLFPEKAIQRITGIFSACDPPGKLATSYFSISIRLRASSEPYNETPLTLPPGRERRTTKPVRSGSAAGAIMMGMVEVSRFAASAGGVPTTTMTSGLSRTSSAASSS